MNRGHAIFTVVVVIIAGLAFAGTYGNGANESGVHCDFSPSVVAVASDIRNQSRFIQLENGANYTLVSAYQNGGVETAYVGGETMSNGAASYTTTLYYPPNWFFWFMPLPSYCASGGSWVGVPFIRATIDVDPDRGFNLSSVGFYQGTFYPNATG